MEGFFYFLVYIIVYFFDIFLEEKRKKKVEIKCCKLKPDILSMFWLISCQEAYDQLMHIPLDSKNVMS